MAERLEQVLSLHIELPRLRTLYLPNIHFPAIIPQHPIPNNNPLTPNPQHNFNPHITKLLKSNDYC